MTREGPTTSSGSWHKVRVVLYPPSRVDNETGYAVFVDSFSKGRERSVVLAQGYVPSPRTGSIEGNIGEVLERIVRSWYLSE